MTGRRAGAGGAGILALIVATAPGVGLARDDDAPAAQEASVTSAIQISPAERGGRSPDGPVGVVRPGSPEDVAALGLRPGPATSGGTPGWIVLARGAHGAPAPTLEVQDVDGAPAAVLTLFLVAPGVGTGRGAGTVWSWRVEAPAPLRLLVRTAAPGATSAGAPGRSGAAVVPTTAPAIQAPDRPVTLVPCGSEAPEATALGLDEATLGRTALLVAQPTAGGRAARLLGAALVGGGPDLRMGVALPLDPGGTPWGPRGGAPTVLAAPRAGERVEWLLTLE